MDLETLLRQKVEIEKRINELRESKSSDSREGSVHETIRQHELQVLREYRLELLAEIRRLLKG